MAKITPVVIKGVPMPIRFGAKGYEYGPLKMESQGNYRFYAIYYIPDRYPGQTTGRARVTTYSIKKQKNGQWYISSIKTRVYKRFGYSVDLTESAGQRYSPGSTLFQTPTDMFGNINSFPTLDKTVQACRMFEKYGE